MESARDGSSEHVRQKGTDNRKKEKNNNNKAGAGEAVLLGALAGGVNAPTWTVLRTVLLALVISLLLLLAVAWNSAGFAPLFHVILLITIAVTLILLLNWFISETGLVPVEQQLMELNLTDDNISGPHEAGPEKQGHTD
ncbi:unnamed protein product [Sphagnum compactum]